MTPEEVRGLSKDERTALLRALIAADDADPLEEPRYRRRRGLALVMLVGCCVWLVPWTIVLAFTLPQHFTAGQWAVAWIGFDVGLTLAIGATAFALWKRLQIAIFGQLVSGTLLVCDAWFDVWLSWGSSEFVLSLLTALLGELPLAALFFLGARQLVLLTVHSLWIREGRVGPEPRLREVRLFAVGQRRR
ncbi:hypothetical protein E1293_35305 [Actinomadura darangshiensis]|uniref:Uncharacterized protein n=1 Tax=Actinomadura darangshiensis TaxID=705336 RepID=A0A4R5AE32_9ACTN|nr:hypothetical protein [Actinomadura darangshiensis]TDD69975.1 hypothetical protein E1293_35305 [Actinomadura darangshiensis]